MTLKRSISILNCGEKNRNQQGTKSHAWKEGPEVCDRHWVSAWTGLTVQMSLADVLGTSKQQKPWRSKEEDPREKVKVDFWDNEDSSFSLPTWTKLIFEIVGSCSSRFESKLGTRLTCTVCACRTSGTVLSVQMSAALKLRLPGLVFHVRLGMDYVHGLPVYRGARTLYASNLWGMTQMQLTNAEEGFLVGEEGLLRETAHLQSWAQ